MNRTKTLLAAIALLLFMNACGQRGPLYLPEPEPDQTAQPQPEEDDEESP